MHTHNTHMHACYGSKTAGRRRRREAYTYQSVGEEDGGVGWPEVAGNLEEEEEKQKERVRGGKERKGRREREGRERRRLPVGERNGEGGGAGVEEVAGVLGTYAWEREGELEGVRQGGEEEKRGEERRRSYQWRTEDGRGGRWPEFFTGEREKEKRRRVGERRGRRV